jgi:hypothetical protein
MKRIGTILALTSFLALPVYAQHFQEEANIRAEVPYGKALQAMPGITLQEYNEAVRDLAKQRATENRRLVVPARPTYVAPPVYVPPVRTVRPGAYVPSAPRYVPPSVTRPSSGTTYDWQSGNAYFWNKAPNGDTNVNGLNANTGSMWNTTIKPDGSMSGYDKDFNSWDYNAGTKTYFNYGTGTMCVGEGALRTCF